jgi:hypothetical protein
MPSCVTTRVTRVPLQATVRGPLGRREPSTRVPNHREVDGVIVGRDADLVVRLEPSPSLPCGNDGNGSFSTKIRRAKQEAHLSDDFLRAELASNAVDLCVES